MGHKPYRMDELIHFLHQIHPPVARPGDALNAPGIFKNYDELNPIAMTFEEGIDLINGNSDLIY
jgi:hypothetical protein